MNTPQESSTQWAAVAHQRLVRLWRAREKCLIHAAMLAPGPNLEKILKDSATVYGQCAEELENPPEKLFRELGYCDDEPDHCRCEKPGPHFHSGAGGKFCAVCGKDIQPNNK